MAMKRNVAQTSSSMGEVPFATAEDAWIWYSQCQLARDEGARFVAGAGEVSRPCAPDDIAREVRRLYRLRVLGGAHLRILARFGGRHDAVRAAGRAEAERDDALWREALDRLAPPLRAKGIIQ